MHSLSRYFFILFLSLAAIHLPEDCFAQPIKNKTDSLYSLYINSDVDSDKVRILLQLSAATNCTDSIKKFGFIENADKIARKLKWNRGRLLCYLNLSGYYSECCQNYAKAIECDQNCVYLSQTLSDKNNEANALERIAKNAENLGQHDLAIDYLKQVLALNTDSRVNMGALGDMGSIYANLGDYRQALISYNTALKLLDEIMHTKKSGEKIDSITRGGLLLNIGDIYLSMSQTEKALENYSQVFKLGTVINDPYLQLFSVINTGKAYFVKKDYSSAIKNLELALYDSRNLGQKVYEASILDQLANAYMALNSMAKAEEYAQASLKITLENSYIKQFPKTYITLGKLLTLKNNYPGAETYLLKALDYCQVTKEIEDEKNTWEALSGVYDKMNQPAKALTAFKHFISLRDSLYNIDKANELVRIDLQAGFNQKQMADSVRQVKQARAYELGLQRQQLLTYSVLLGLAMVLLLSFFIYRNYTTQKKYNDLLSKEKANHLAHIEAQSNTLTDIAHIQSHDIRGPVSTLLGLVKVFNFEDPNDPDNKEVIEGIAVVTERLDAIVRDVVQKENIIHSKESSIQGKK